MNKNLKQLLVFLSFLLGMYCQSCDPLYLRIFYDPQTDSVLKVDMIAMFNTFDQCSDSYIETTYLNSQAEFACTVKMIQIIQQNKTYFQQWVHTCNLELDSPSQVDSFNYRVSGGSADTNYTLVELTSESLPFIAVVTANLNLLDDKKYPPFAQAFQELLSRRDTQIANDENKNHYRINGMVINGGFAQNFTGNRGLNYNKIMTLLGQYSNRWPLLLNLGPKEINNHKDFSLIQDCFVLGGLQSDQPTGMQSYSFSRKVKIILLQTSAQYSAGNKTEIPQFQQTLSSLSSLLKNNHEQWNDFSIAFNHYDLTCDDASINSVQTHKCDVDTANLSPLLNLLTSSHGQQNDPIDLYVGAYQDNYQRNYPIKNGSYDTQEDASFDRGEFVAINQGTGGLGLLSQPDVKKTYNQAIQQFGKPGFGLITIHGNGDLPKQNASIIQMKQTLVRKIEQAQSNATSSTHQDTNSKILDDTYLHNEDLNELDLFLLNYKHITINGTELLVEDVFRIITEPIVNSPVLRHHLTAA